MRLRFLARWLLPFSVMLATLVIVPLRILDEQGLPRYHTLRDKLDEAKDETADLEEEVRVLKHQIEALRSDPRAIEHVAREDLGLVREDEIVFQFEDK